MIDLSALNLDRVLNIGVSLSKERNLPKLLDAILTEAMEITCCDAGTLYLHEDNQLKFEIMRTHSMNVYLGGDEDPVCLPPVAIKEENVCAYVLLHRTLENIEDVYSSQRFDFSGPQEYDKLTGYRTKSMLVIPLEDNRGEVVGVLQLINALDSEGRVISFDKNYEKIFSAMASQAAIAVTNMKYLKENQDLLQSVVEVFAAAIDERSHYNGNHTRNVVDLTSRFMEFINLRHDCGMTQVCFPEEDQEQLIMAAWLHDIGKIITPIEIMDKSTRLGTHLPLIEMRFDAIYAAENVRFLKGEMTDTEWENIRKEITGALNLCTKMNNYNVPASEKELAVIASLSKRTTALPTGQIIPWLETIEAEELAIRNGTLTAEERKIMEEHVAITTRLLRKINFPARYEKVSDIVERHHEKLNGRGYPRGLHGENLPMGTRLLTVIDIFEALTAQDRPYKKPLTVEAAVAILDEMVRRGELDGVLVQLLKEWQHVETSPIKEQEERSNDFSVRFWGVRGSSSCSSEDKMRYGCNTSCVQVTAGTTRMILDMGSGAFNLGQYFIENAIEETDIFISHFHYDHIEGIPFFAPFFKGGKYRIYSEKRGGKSVGALLRDYMQDPYFPVSTEVFVPGVEYCDFEENAVLKPADGIKVETIHSFHPEFSTAYKISFESRSVVYLVDYEHGSDSDEALALFCKDTDLLIYDAPYSEDEYLEERLQGWGHSTFQAGIALAQRTGVKKLIFTHHAKDRTDKQIAELEKELKTHYPNLCFAGEGLEILL